MRLTAWRALSISPYLGFRGPRVLGEFPSEGSAGDLPLVRQERRISRVGLANLILNRGCGCRGSGAHTRSHFGSP
jgi:hypothetical protein